MTDADGPYILRAGESVRPAGPMRFLVDAEKSAGRLTLYEGILPVGGPPLHVHDFDEVLLILEGRALVQLGDEISELGPGDFAWLASGHEHTFANPGPDPLRGIGLAIPSGIEDLFEERGRYLSTLGQHESPEPAEMSRIYAAHASRVVGPPISI